MATIGFDIEFFVADNKTNSIIPVCNKLGGDKRRHITLKVEGKPDIEVHEDNVCLEANSPVFENAADAVNWLGTLVRDLNVGLKGMPFHIAHPQHQVTQKFPMPMLEEVGNKALEIGCDPDFSAYAEVPEVPRQIQLNAFNGGVRYAGGHVHLGYSTHENIPPKYIAQLLDLIHLYHVGPCDRGRCTGYGPGLFRPKPYGIEYRTMSTFDLIRVWQFASGALNLAKELENNPQSVAEFYSEFDFKDIESVLSNPSSDENLRYRIVNAIDAAESENYFFSPAGIRNVPPPYTHDWGLESKPGRTSTKKKSSLDKTIERSVPKSVELRERARLRVRGF